MTRTTPPRPADVAAVFPQLASLARTAIRLHPYPGSPSPHDSSIGGPLLWPAAEPWPYCDGPHEPDGVNPATSLEDVRLDRRIRVAALRRPHRDPYYPEYTPEELAIEKRIRVGCPWPVGRLAMLPVAQLCLRDIPVLRPPGPADVLQVLRCPFEHPSDYQPETALFWRSAAAVTDILTTPPEPTAVQNRGSGVPEPCLLDPEQVTEYPNHMELSEDLQELVGQWSARRADGAVPDNLDAVDSTRSRRDPRPACRANGNSVTARGCSHGADGPLSRRGPHGLPPPPSFPLLAHSRAPGARGHNH